MISGAICLGSWVWHLLALECPVLLLHFIYLEPGLGRPQLLSGSLFPWPAWRYSVVISRWDVFLCGWFPSEWVFHEVQVEAARPSQSNLISPSMSLLHILLVRKVRIADPDSRRWKNRLVLSMWAPWHEGSGTVMAATLETSCHTWGRWEDTFFEV